MAELIEQGQPEELTTQEVAAASGLSLRTIYRDYPAREQLLEATGHWIGDELLQHPYPQTLDQVADLFEAGCAEFGQRPRLVRAMALSQLGRSVRAYRRQERLAAIGAALRAEVGGLPEAELRRAEAILAYLHSMLAFTTLHEESGLSPKQAGEAVGWAIRTLVDDLRRKQRRAKERT